MTVKHAPAAISDNEAISIDTQTEENHPLGKVSSGYDNYEANTHGLCKRGTHMRTESADYSSSPPELTDSEDEYDSEADAEDSVLAERHPSGSTSSAITSSISS